MRRAVTFAGSGLAAAVFTGLMVWRWNHEAVRNYDAGPATWFGALLGFAVAWSLLYYVARNSQEALR